MTKACVDLLSTNLSESIAAKQSLLEMPQVMQAFADAVGVIVEKYLSGGRLYAAGNGGSAADAQHLVAELVVRLGRERRSLPAEALTTDPSVMTAIGNDYGYEQVFARQLAGKAGPSDVFLAITTSGKSPNILAALKQCQQQGTASVLFSGRDGGPAAELADHKVVVPGARTSTIQELHIVLAHSLCEAVENQVCFAEP